MLDLPKHKDVIMAGYLLNVGYLALLVLCSPLLLYAAVCKGKYRAGFAAKFLGRVPIRSGHRSCVWFHAVSVGEVQLVAPIVAKLRERLPELQIVISTTTHTGYAVAKRKYDCHTVFYCPLDFTWSTAVAMRRIRPSVVVLAELELWPNLVRAARRYGSKVAVVNGRLSDHSFRGYLRIRPVVSRLLKSINLVAAQNQTYADRFLRLGAEPAAVRQARGGLSKFYMQVDLDRDGQWSNHEFLLFMQQLKLPLSTREIEQVFTRLALAGATARLASGMVVPGVDTSNAVRLEELEAALEKTACRSAAHR